MKTFKKVVLAILALVCICIPASMIQAQGITVDVDTRSEVTELETVVWKDATKKPEYKAYAVQLTKEENGNAEYIVPINIPSKGILFVGTELPEEDGLYTYVDLYKDEECQNSIYISSTNLCADIEKAGTYYFKFSVSDYRETQERTCVFGVATCLISGENVTLKNKEEVVSAVIDYSQPIYYKVNASKQGTITFNVEGTSSSNVTLCNSKKKAITEEISSTANNGKYVYAVAKGTYYIKVKTYSDTISVKSTYKATKDASGTTRAKATKLKFGASSKNGLVLATDKNKKAYWFKFYNNKNQKVTVNITGLVLSGEVKVEFYYANGKKFTSDYTKLNQYSNNASFSPFVSRFYATSGNLPKGTYYIKITKNEKLTTGTYSINVKNK